MATSINSYSVSLGMDASGYIKGAELSRAETRALMRDIEAARTPAERYENAVERLTTAKAKNAIQTGTFIRLMDEEKRKLDAASNSASTNAASMEQITGKLKALASAYLGMQTVTKSIRLAIDAEQAAAQFEILTGSMEDAKLLGQQIRDFAAVSPVSLIGAQNAAKMMLAFNIQVQDVQRNLQMLGDISGGNQARFDSLTLAFSQMSSAGRLMGQDLLQMVQAGFNPLQEISRKTGESMSDLKARMEAGKIATDEVTEAFISATSAGGRFDGMTERMAETMGGKLAIASANLELALTKLGASMGPLVITLTEGMDKGTSAVDKLNEAVLVLSEGLAFLLALGMDLSEGGGQLAAVLGYSDGRELKHTNAMLDMREKRLRELEQASKLPTEFSKPPVGIEEAKKVSEELLKKWQDAQDKETEKWLDELDKEEERRLQMIERQARAALGAAERVFEKERENVRRLNEEIAKGPGGGMEAGSADAARFAADQANAAIAASVIKDQPLPTDEQLVDEARRQRELLEIADAREREMLDVMKMQLNKEPQLARAR